MADGARDGSPLSVEHRSRWASSRARRKIRFSDTKIAPTTPAIKGNSGGALVKRARHIWHHTASSVGRERGDRRNDCASQSRTASWRAHRARRRPRGSLGMSATPTRRRGAARLATRPGIRPPDRPPHPPFRRTHAATSHVVHGQKVRTRIISGSHVRASIGRPPCCIVREARTITPVPSCRPPPPRKQRAHLTDGFPVNRWPRA